MNPEAPPRNPPRFRRPERGPHLPFGDQRHAPFYGRDVLSVRQFDRASLEYVCEVAREMGEMVSRVGAFDLLRGKVLASLFYEPSTRTSSSFLAAMQRLGGTVIPINEVRYSSVAKGESLPDTVRTLEAYADVIVLRHPEVGAAELAAQHASKPIINAGDGVGEHPTQALLDLYTILAERDQVDGLTVTLLGDLRHGRTVHSLARLLSLYDVKLRYVSPPSLRMPERIVAEIAQGGHGRAAPGDGAGVVEQSEHEELEEVLAQTDVLYVTRVQKERFVEPSEYDSVRDAYLITPALMQGAPADMVLMHPFPRVGEIAMEVDDDPRAAYFRQMEYGLYVRMALLAMVLGKA